MRIDFFRNLLCLKKLANFAKKMPKRAILASKWSFERSLIKLGLFFLAGCSLKNSEPVALLLHEQKERLCQIEAIEERQGKDFLVISKEEFEVSPFSNLNDSWALFQRVKLKKSAKLSYYNLVIENLDNEEEISARRIEPNCG